MSQSETPDAGITEQSAPDGLMAASALAEEQENEEGQRYIVDGMLHEVNDHFTIRFVVDYTKIKNERFLNYISVINSSVYNLRKPPANSSTSCNNLAVDKGENIKKLLQADMINSLIINNLTYLFLNMIY